MKSLKDTWRQHGRNLACGAAMAVGFGCGTVAYTKESAAADILARISGVKDACPQSIDPFRFSLNCSPAATVEAGTLRAAYNVNRSQAGFWSIAAIAAIGGGALGLTGRRTKRVAVNK